MLYYYATFILAFLIILFYGKYRCDHPYFKDPLEYTFFGEIDLWSINHFIFFTFLGYLFPKTFWSSLIIGILWELFETFNGIYKPKIFNGYGHCDKLTSDRPDGLWWYGKSSDIIMNTLGFAFGYYLNKNTLKNIT